MDEGTDVLAHVAQELVSVVGVELPQERETARDKRRPIQRVSWLFTQ